MLTRSTGVAVSARGRGAAAIDHVDVKVGYGIDSSADLRWLDRKWRVLAKGNLFLNVRGYILEVYKTKTGR
ncbi:MAG TPA: hypothetical protein ACQGQJ_00700 [Xylella fastidiosa subsp. multiplex]